MRTVEELQQNVEEQARLREEAAAEQVRQAAAERIRKEQAQETDSIRSEARIAIDVWIIYKRHSAQGLPAITKGASNPTGRVHRADTELRPGQTRGNCASVADAGA